MHNKRRDNHQGSYAQQEDITIPRLDLRNIKDDSTIAIIAPRRSGKSVLVKDILYNKRTNFAYGLVVSSTENVNRFYGEFIPDIFIHTEYDPVRIAGFIQKQTVRVMKEGKHDGNKAFLILDDVLHDQKVWKNDSSLKNIFFNGRHINLCFIILIQDTMGLTPAFRNNLDATIIFYNEKLNEHKKIFEHYSSQLDTFQSFQKVYSTVCKDHRALIFMREGIYNYKAKIIEYPFRVGSPSFWHYHDSKYDNEYFLRNNPIKELNLKKGSRRNNNSTKQQVIYY